MKSANFKMAVKLLMLVFIMSALTGCGGANFVRGNMDPLKGNEKVGVLVIRHEVWQQKLFGNVSISDKLDRLAAEKVATELNDQLAKKGFTPIVLPASEKMAALAKSYKDLPRSGRHVVNDPQVADFGDLRGLFKEYGIDHILVYEGECVPRKGALASFGAAGLNLGIGLITNSIISTGPAKGFTITYTGIVEPNGKLAYYNREQFTKKGDFFSADQRKDMLEAIIDEWAQAQK